MADGGNNSAARQHTYFRLWSGLRGVVSSRASSDTPEMFPSRSVLGTLASVLAGSAWLTLWHAFQEPGAPGAAGETWFGDVGGFARFGESLFTGDLAGVYADPWNQAGPLQVIAAFLSVRFSEAVGLPWGPSLVMVVVVALTLGIVAWVTHWLLAHTQISSRFSAVRPWLPALVVTMAVATESITPLFISGHWMQMPTVGLWLLAVRLIRRPTLSGFLIGIACLLEPWAVFGIPLLLLSPTWRQRFLAAAVSILTAIIGWVPFIVQPGFSFHRLSWPLHEGSPWTIVLEPTAPFPWPLRIVQTFIVLGVFGLLWSVLRGHMPVAWLAVSASACMLLARVAFDPKTGDYYTAPSALLILSMLACCLLAATPRCLGVAPAWWMAIPYNAKFLGTFTAPSLALIVLVLTLLTRPRAWADITTGPDESSEEPQASGKRRERSRSENSMETSQG